jgi:hypothetical protein
MVSIAISQRPIFDFLFLLSLLYLPARTERYVRAGILYLGSWIFSLIVALQLRFSFNLGGINLYKAQHDFLILVNFYTWF